MGTINHLFQGGGELEIRLIPNPENAKSDAALLLMHGPDRKGLRDGNKTDSV